MHHKYMRAMLLSSLAALASYAGTNNGAVRVSPGGFGLQHVTVYIKWLCWPGAFGKGLPRSVLTPLLQYVAMSGKEEHLSFSNRTIVRPTLSV